MSLLRYLSSTILEKFAKKPAVDTSKIIGGANEEAAQNEVSSFYHS
ncbi:hypothetical protein C8N46_105339 [Kordia periserrulae]|uniref:Uncharacterized protein n=1 Tax=Kordia periserrulae TaxID=701523 RepID=A0A2T6BYP3_9FLAO|nr:hypothetical protein [Kordia periserrulae]PTX61182.1 hypothetical protein C8N46_105339 [Kordia periserrulae]